MALDLIDAVLETLEANEAIVEAFGITADTHKFYGDVVDQVPLPYCQIMEVGEQYQYMTRAGPVGPINYIATGNMQFVIWNPARAGLRSLGMLIGQALNDAALVWPAETTMEFRMMNSSLGTHGDTGPLQPIKFSRIFTFEYVWSSNL